MNIESFNYEELLAWLVIAFIGLWSVGVAYFYIFIRSLKFCKVLNKAQRGDSLTDEELDILKDCK